jgi:hypothetical protein
MDHSGYRVRVDVGVRQMRMEMEYQGKTYKMKATDEMPQGKVAEGFYKNFPNMDRLKMELEDGSIIVIGKIALQSSVIRIYA